MATRRNGVYIIQGEISLVVSALRRNVRWGSHSHQDEEQDPLLHGFSQLKDLLCTVNDLSEVDVNTFLGPFLDVIRSEDTTGPITGVALTSVNKFLSYGLIDPSSESAASGIENLADAVTHARFVGTDPSSDEVVLMKILQVLRTLLLTPVGAHMTNESVCEIMQSCFRICFETRLSELLRRSAEQTLMDMVQLLFSRMPQFKEDFKPGQIPNIRKVFKRAGAISSGKKKKHASPKPRRAHHDNTHSTTPTEEQTSSVETANQPQTKDTETKNDTLHTTEEITSSSKEIPEEDGNTMSDVPNVPSGSEGDIIERGSEEQETGPSSSDTAEPQSDEGPSVASQIMHEGDGDSISVEGMVISEEERDGHAERVNEQDGTESIASTIMTEEDIDDNKDVASVETDDGDDVVEVHADGRTSEMSGSHDEYVNPRGVRFTPQEPTKDGTGPLVPYGLPCIRELFRFLISLINPHDRHNSEAMIHMGLSLLTVALEAGAHHLGNFTSLMNLVKDDMCKNLFMLLQCDFLGLFAMAMRVCFLLFEALRTHLKLQFEMFFKRLMDILAMDFQSVPYEKRELILDAINQLFRVPNLVTELYLNYDCDLYCTNVFEELCKLLSKNAFPSAGSLFSVHILALDALLAVVQGVEGHCHAALVSSMEKAVEDSIPVSRMEKMKKKEKIGDDDDSGPDDSYDTPELNHPSPPTSGFAMAQKMRVGVVSGDSLAHPDHVKDESTEKITNLLNERFHGLSTGLLFSSSLPTPEMLARLKQKKKLLQAGSEQFNNKPKKGIEFLQEHNLLHRPLEPEEMARFLRENPRLDKKTIGEYIGNKHNAKVLDAFVRSFTFHDLRVDESLRSFLETFRLPGESPVIEHIMEYFSEYFFESNPDVYAHKDAVFTLTYAVIMLNVDQHNTNIKQQKPMTVEDFKRNLRKINGGVDFPASMLEEIYHAIRTEEIVMPAERTGRIRENYDWKILLRRSTTHEGKYINGVDSSFDQDLFAIIWGPTVAALSYVYDNALEKNVVQKAISGFRRCSLISAHYSLSDVFDNLVISLCKFTTLLNSPEAGESLAVAFGGNLKAQQSARTVFGLAHRHGDILREGWKNIMDCMLQLFKAKLLPNTMVEAEDFVDASGRVSLLKEEQPVAKTDTSLFSWYQYLVNPEPAITRGQTPEDKEAQKQAQTVIRDLHPELLITESKFLRFESLNELIKVLTYTSNPDNYESIGVQCDEESAVFCLELLIRVVLQNRDRVSMLWHTIRDHLSNIIINASHHSSLVERSVVGLLRLAIRLLRKEEISSQVLTTLRVLLMMKHSVLMACGRQICFGLHELLRTNASSITTTRDWITVFTLIECVGAAATPPTVTARAPAPAPTVVKDVDSDSAIGECESVSDGLSTCDSEVGSFTAIEADSGTSISGDTWLLISKDESDDLPANQYDLTVSVQLNKHDSKCFIKSCQSLTFLIRDCNHVRKENFLHCIHAVRVYAEASLNSAAGLRQNEHQFKDPPPEPKTGRSHKKGSSSKSRKSPTGITKRKSARSSGNSSSTSEDEVEIFETINNAYDAMSLQLIELIYALHTHAAGFYDKNTTVTNTNKQASQNGPTVSPTAQTPIIGTQVPAHHVQVEEPPEAGVEMGFLWTKCWCPLLQGIARLCCDNRKEVRMSALTYLQRALLVHDMQTLTAVEWESCFNKVLFPMLARLLEVNNTGDPIGLEETRMRAATLLCKVFLQHLTPLLSLSTFTALWLTILDFMDKYMHADKSDLLYEAIPESLKNMLLVMSTAGIFEQEDYTLSLGNVDKTKPAGPRLARTDSEIHRYSALWQVTWERIDCFLPNLKQELFLRSQPSSRASSPLVNRPDSDGEPVTEKQEQPVKVEGGEAKPNPDARPTSPPPTGTSITSPPQGQQVCVMLQPPLPSLGNRSGSPTQLGSLADNVRTRTSVPIILAPSPELNKKAAKPVQPEPQPTNENTENSHEPSLREDSNIDLTPVIEEDLGSDPATDQTQDKPPKTVIYDI